MDVLNDTQKWKVYRTGGHWIARRRGVMEPFTAWERAWEHAITMANMERTEQP